MVCINSIISGIQRQKVLTDIVDTVLGEKPELRPKID